MPRTRASAHDPSTGNGRACRPGPVHRRARLRPMRGLRSDSKARASVRTSARHIWSRCSAVSGVLEPRCARPPRAFIEKAPCRLRPCAPSGSARRKRRVRAAADRAAGSRSSTSKRRPGTGGRGGWRFLSSPSSGRSGSVDSAEERAGDPWSESRTGPGSVMGAPPARERDAPGRPSRRARPECPGRRAAETIVLRTSPERRPPGRLGLGKHRDRPCSGAVGRVGGERYGRRAPGSSVERARTERRERERRGPGRAERPLPEAAREPESGWNPRGDTEGPGRPGRRP